LNQSNPVTQPTLIEADRSIILHESVTGICGRCCTPMPQHALDVFSPGVPPDIKPWGWRCKNAVACTDRERKMMMRMYERVARAWDIRGAA
jgi:hypothetical protein